MNYIAAIAVVLMALTPACPPSPAPPKPDASDAAPPTPITDAQPPQEASLPPPPADGGSTPCAAACANLAALGCQEGKAPNCRSVCEHSQGTITDLHPAELAKARTKAEVRALKVACP